jgi:cyclopropane-fatty-acyl-phospholipid synthase
MWECYLAASEASFRHEDLVVFQFQLTKRNDVIPLTRNYVDARKASLRQAEAAAPPRPAQDNWSEEERRAGR